jgi:hypothetical protein
MPFVGSLVQNSDGVSGAPRGLELVHEAEIASHYVSLIALIAHPTLSQVTISENTARLHEDEGYSWAHVTGQVASSDIASDRREELAFASKPPPFGVTLVMG